MEPPVYGYDQNRPIAATPSSMSSQQQNTTVVINQPTSMVKPVRLWSTGIFGCCDDMAICLFGTFCGVCHAGVVSTDMGESCCVPCCVPGADIVLRVKWRTQENIQGSIMDDCCTTMCCGPCAMCQLAREIKYKRMSAFAFPA